MTDCHVLDWASSGLMWLTGAPDGPPLPAPGPVMSFARDELDALPSARPDLVGILAGRAGSRGLSRGGRRSAGGATRLLRGEDGWVALTLARPDDGALLRAAFPQVPDPCPDLWEAAASAVAGRPCRESWERLQLVGLPAGCPTQGTRARPPVVATRLADPSPRPLRGSLVVDLSAMWAGPTCAKLLGDAGARVVKVESPARLDGARRGDARHFDWLHAGHESVLLDLSAEAGRRDLQRLLLLADVVIEASRPRALHQWGLSPSLVPHPPGRVWVSITGYGRDDPQLVAFGDDAAAAGGLLAWHEDVPSFCADAIADPLTGIVAAAAAARSLERGGGHLLDVSMCDVARRAAQPDPGATCTHDVLLLGDQWWVTCSSGGRRRVEPPRPLPRTPRAAAAGEHTRSVLAGS